jgi:hypothetical protein
MYTQIALVLALVLGLVAVEAGPTFPAKLIGSDLRPVVASSCNSTRTDFSCCGQLEFIMHFPYIGMPSSPWPAITRPVSSSSSTRD